MRIDAHHHLWDPARGDYNWLDASCGPLLRAYQPDDLAPLLRDAGVERTLLVQAAPTEAETAWLLEIARTTPWIAGVIGWTDLAAADAPARIAALAADPLLVGLRPMLQDLPDAEYILRPELALDAMSEAGLVFDALVRAHQLPAIATLADRHPGLTIVLDHAGKPAIGTDLSAWREDTAALARCPNAHAKLSGLLTEAPAGADAAMLAPVVDHLLETFGPDRLIWGSDWPVLTLTGDYGRWAGMSDALLSSLDEAQRAAVFGGNAARLYRLAISGPAVILLHPDDNVVVCCRDVAAGEFVTLDGGEAAVSDTVTLGHKLARRPIGAGERIVKYGMPIGSATAPIGRGDWVHMHNMKSDYIAAHGRDAAEAAA